MNTPNILMVSCLPGAVLDESDWVLWEKSAARIVLTVRMALLRNKFWLENQKIWRQGQGSIRHRR